MVQVSRVVVVVPFLLDFLTQFFSSILGSIAHLFNTLLFLVEISWSPFLLLISKEHHLIHSYLKIRWQVVLFSSGSLSSFK